MHPRVCDPERLDLFLRNRLAVSHQQEVEAHLLVCPACRNKLDELAGGACWWTEVRRYLGGDGATQLVPGADPTRFRRTPEVVLDFVEAVTASLLAGAARELRSARSRGAGGYGCRAEGVRPGAASPGGDQGVGGSICGARRGTKAVRPGSAGRGRAVIHDHVVPVYGVDADATPPYLVMAFIAGQSLQQRIDKTGPLELKEVLRIGMQTAARLGRRPRPGARAPRHQARQHHA